MKSESLSARIPDVENFIPAIHLYKGPAKISLENYPAVCRSEDFIDLCQIQPQKLTSKDRRTKTWAKIWQGFGNQISIDFNSSAYCWNPFISDSNFAQKVISSEADIKEEGFGGLQMSHRGVTAAEQAYLNSLTEFCSDDLITPIKSIPCGLDTYEKVVPHILVHEESGLLLRNQFTTILTWLDTRVRLDYLVAYVFSSLAQ